MSECFREDTTVSNQATGSHFSSAEQTFVHVPHSARPINGMHAEAIRGKRSERIGHLQDLKKVFEHLRKYQLKLNPAKCTFGVTSGKLLGFLISQKGIEIDPSKIKAILDNGRRLYQICKEMPQVSDTRGSTASPFERTTGHGFSLAFLSLGHRHHRPHTSTCF